MSSSPIPLNSHRPHILVVEDDPLIADLVANALEGAGFDVTAVAAAEDALGYAVMDIAFDALVTDINLAGPLDGWELAATMREMQPDLPVVYASGSVNGPERALAVPGAAILSKPYNPLALCDLVSSVVSPRMIAPPAGAITLLSGPSFVKSAGRRCA
jgi:CheY-like chemotaxis protein